MKNLSGFARSMNFLAGNCRILWKILEASFRSCQDMQQESKWQWTWGGENCTGESGLRAHQSGNTSTIGGSIVSTSSAVKIWNQTPGRWSQITPSPIYGIVERSKQHKECNPLKGQIESMFPLSCWIHTYSILFYLFSFSPQERHFGDLLLPRPTSQMRLLKPIRFGVISRRSAVLRMRYFQYFEKQHWNVAWFG